MNRPLAWMQPMSNPLAFIDDELDEHAVAELRKAWNASRSDTAGSSPLGRSLTRWTKTGQSRSADRSG
jgi:hypothetical protein